MPINNYMLATEPLPEATARRLIRDDTSVSDTRFVVDYWKLSADNRLLFGGGETYSRRLPTDIKRFVRPHMLRIYPELAEDPNRLRLGRHPRHHHEPHARHRAAVARRSTTPTATRARRADCDPRRQAGRKSSPVRPNASTSCPACPTTLPGGTCCAGRGWWPACSSTACATVSRADHGTALALRHRPATAGNSSFATPSARRCPRPGPEP